MKRLVVALALCVAAQAARTQCADGRQGKWIADSLRVATIVEGAVLKSGSRVRVSVRLIEASTGYAMWVEQVNSSETGLFELQDTVSRAIASRLGDAGAKRLVNRRTTSVEAQDRYLRGRDLLYRRDPASHLAVREEFRRAILAVWVRSAHL
jgi:adenylate cyclase